MTKSLLALDIDGTLLDDQGTLRPGLDRLLQKAHDAQIRVVLCTGRRYRRALPVAKMLGIATPLVCHSGALLKQTETHQTLYRADLSACDASLALDLIRQNGFQAVSFLDEPEGEGEFLVERMPTGCPDFDEFVIRNDSRQIVDPLWMTNSDRRTHFHLCGIGSLEAMEQLQKLIAPKSRQRLQTYVMRSTRYRGALCEIVRAGASKWSALLELCRLWNCLPEQIIAVGDDSNDVPMLAGAGWSLAMPHAPESVRQHAKEVLDSSEPTALANRLESFLCARVSTLAQVKQ